MPTEDGWDWSWIVYTGVVILGVPEAIFLKWTPRKFKALADVHLQLHGKRSNEQKSALKGKVGFIDQVL